MSSVNSNERIPRILESKMTNVSGIKIARGSRQAESDFKHTIMMSSGSMMRKMFS